MDKGRFGAPAGVRDWALALGVAALLVGTEVSEEDPGTDPDVLGYALLAAAASHWPRDAALR
ncbi:hypothetical protein ACFCWG_34350 [Streptomyces sp. NPDC056390]|uniref:hypothetical protein n=1 Tax=Streptomyces sp. NPDC056390 TaxID=3345806 RepID=UPI0035DEF65E